MDVEFFQSVDFCLKVLNNVGLYTKNKYLWILCISTHFICFNGLLLETISELNFKNDELCKTAEKLTIILAMIRASVMSIRIIIEQKNIEKIIEKVREIIGKVSTIKTNELKKSIKAELSVLEKVIKFFLTLIIMLTLCLIITMKMYHNLPFNFFYPFDLKYFHVSGWIQVAGLHQTYCYSFLCIILVCNSYLFVVFISYSIAILGEIHNQLYYHNGIDREEIFIKCMESYKMIKKLATEISGQYHIFFLLQNFLIITQISLLAFIISESNEMKNSIIAVLILFVIIFELLVPFNYGQDLENRSRQTIEAFSYPKWRYMSVKLENSRRKFISKNEQSLKIRVIKVFILNLRAFIVLVIPSVLMSILFKFFLTFYWRAFNNDSE